MGYARKGFGGICCMVFDVLVGDFLVSAFVCF